MERQDRIAQVDTHLVQATARSLWILVEIRTAAGARGLGDATLHVSARVVREAIAQIGQAVVNLPLHGALRTLHGSKPASLVEASAICAVDQALHDLAGQRYGVSIAGLLCREPSPRVEVYANINRGTVDRSPSGFAQRTARAVAAGYRTVKLAPFDDLTPDSSGPAAAAALRKGIERLSAVRAALGPRRRLLVDCHWRLNAATLPPVLEACSEFKVHWLECPISEGPDRYDEIRRCRTALNDLGVLAAGGEFSVGRAAFDELITAGCYDVLMPDMRYVGGYAEFLAVAQSAAQAGIMISPHNPAGPVCHAHSVQAAAAAPGVSLLETQFEETKAFRSIVSGDLATGRRGWIRTPRSPGLGLALRHDRLEAFAPV